MSRVLLFDIPAELQKQYNIGPEVEAEASADSPGRSFVLTNKANQVITLHLLDFHGHDVGVREIRP